MLGSVGSADSVGAGGAFRTVHFTDPAPCRAPTPPPLQESTPAQQPSPAASVDKKGKRKHQDKKNEKKKQEKPKPPRNNFFVNTLKSFFSLKPKLEPAEYAQPYEFRKGTLADFDKLPGVGEGEGEGAGEGGPAPDADAALGKLDERSLALLATERLWYDMQTQHLLQPKRHYVSAPYSEVLEYLRKKSKKTNVKPYQEQTQPVVWRAAWRGPQPPPGGWGCGCPGLPCICLHQPRDPPAPIPRERYRAGTEDEDQLLLGRRLEARLQAEYALHRLLRDQPPPQISHLEELQAPLFCMGLDQCFPQRELELKMLRASDRVRDAVAKPTTIDDHETVESFRKKAMGSYEEVLRKEEQLKGSQEVLRKEEQLKRLQDGPLSLCMRKKLAIRVRRQAQEKQKAEDEAALHTGRFGRLSINWCHVPRPWPFARSRRCSAHHKPASPVAAPAPAAQAGDTACAAAARTAHAALPLVPPVPQVPPSSATTASTVTAALIRDYRLPQM